MVKLFEAFFWIEPGRPNVNSAFNSARAIWHYPQNVSEISKEFKDIPQFCFPDLENVRIERAEKCFNEHFMFTLVDKDDQRMYGICMRGLYQGESKRHDVKRRPRHCLCFISRHPYISLFRTLLLQVHSLSLVEQGPGNGRMFLEQLYEMSGDRKGGDRILISRLNLPTPIRDFNVVVPKYVRLSRVATILPLLECYPM